MIFFPKLLWDSNICYLDQESYELLTALPNICLCLKIAFYIHNLYKDINSMGSRAIKVCFVVYCIVLTAKTILSVK